MKVEQISKADWLSYVINQKHVSLFEFPIWYSIWEEYFDTTSTAFLIDDYFLLSCIHLYGAKGLIKYNNSSPAGTYSNFRSIKGNSNLSLREFKEIQKITDINFLRLAPFSNLMITEGSSESLTDFTQIIQLSTLDKIDQDWSRNHRRMYQKAVSSKLEVIKTNDQNDWNQYIDLYKMFVNKIGSEASSSYQARLFESIFKIDNKYRDLWIVKKQDKLIAGRLVFYTKDYAVEWHASSSIEANSQGANQLLIYHILEDAKSREIEIYDFNPSGGHKGVVSFKEKFGSITKKSPVFKNYNWGQKLYLKTR